MTREEATAELNTFKVGAKSELGENALDMAIEALEQEPCEDCISRKAVLEYIEGSEAELGHSTENELVCQDIKEFPPVTPQPKIGKWEWVQYDCNPKIGNWHCSECRSIVIECVSKKEKGSIPLYRYCPQCGAKMEVEE